MLFPSPNGMGNNMARWERVFFRVSFRDSTRRIVGGQGSHVVLLMEERRGKRPGDRSQETGEWGKVEKAVCLHPQNKFECATREAEGKGERTKEEFRIQNSGVRSQESGVRSQERGVRREETSQESGEKGEGRRGKKSEFRSQESGER